jgi:hypothetical protein
MYYSCLYYLAQLEQLLTSWQSLSCSLVTYSILHLNHWPQVTVKSGSTVPAIILIYITDKITEVYNVVQKHLHECKHTHT